MNKTQLLPWVGWRQSYLSIHVGPMPPGGVSLQQLGEVEILAPLVDRIGAGFAADRLYAALTALHYAVGAVSQLLVAPFALDGMSLAATPDALGIVHDSSAAPATVWIRDGIAAHNDSSTTSLGETLLATLGPIRAATTTLTGTPGRVVTLIVMDALYRSCRRLERAADCRVESGWVDAMLSAMSDPERPTRRTFLVAPDAGPPIAMTIPRVCCVLATGAHEQACPTCPQRSNNDRVETTEAWLQSLDDDAFLAETGRLPIRASH